MKTSKFKRAFSFVLVIALAFTMALVAVPTETQAATAKKITLSASKKTIGVGKSFTLKVKSVKGLSSKNVTWKTSKKSVAKLSSKKKTSVKVTGVKKGTATITATSKKNKKIKATCKVTVKKAVTKVQAATTVYVKKGKKINLTKQLVITPSTAYKKVSYKSSNKKIATVNSKGVVTGKKKGTAKITIKAKDGSGKKKTVTVKVTKKAIKKVTSVKLNTKSLTLTAGQTYTLKATLKPAKRTAKKANWTSSNWAAASVNQSGKITAKNVTKKTTVSIVAMAGDSSYKKATCTVTIIPAATSVTVTPPTATLLKVGDTVKLSASVAPADASQTVTWTTSSEKIAKVDATGKVTAVANGTATITAKTANGKTGTAKITVSIPSSPTTVGVTGVTVSKTTVDLKAGETVKVKANVAPTNASDQNITWTSAKSGVATVAPATSKSGEEVTITGVAAGTTTITAKSTNGKTATVTVNVTAQAEEETTPTLNSVQISPEEITLTNATEDEKSTTLEAIVDPADPGKEVSYEWTVVDKDELVAISGEGAKVTVTALGDSGTAKVKVTASVEGEEPVEAGATVTVKWNVFSYSEDLGYYLVELEEGNKYEVSVDGKTRTIDVAALDQAFKKYTKSVNNNEIEFNAEYFWNHLDADTINEYITLAELTESDAKVTVESAENDDNVKNITVTVGDKIKKATITNNGDETFTINSDDKNVLVSDIEDVTSYGRRTVSATIKNIDTENDRKIGAIITENKIEIAEVNDSSPVASIEFDKESGKYTIWADFGSFNKLYNKLLDNFESLPKLETLQAATVYKVTE